MDFTLSLASFFVGVLVGLTGVGGAALMTPLLILFFNVPGSIAIGSDIVSATLMKVVGGYKHWQQETVDLEIVKWLALGSVPGSFLGIAFLHYAKAQGMVNLDGLMIRFVGFVILIVAVSALATMFIKTFAKGIKLIEMPKIDLKTQQGRIAAMAIGAVLGSAVGLTSVGSGSLFALALIAFFRLDPQKLVGTDIVQAAILLIFTAVGHWSLGTVNWSLVFPIWLGTVPGVLVGAKLCTLTPKPALQFALYSILVTVGWQLVNKA
ncbi:sulfite exporter TauE/SafE family protein [Candidatus Cyanaurora vandensis]|uniref:sulfite exporter TauE/SafE family protein n=1 Tax=Candidatus Cyanaurora vandensis TaxID=2714958 RepID=UPI0025805997|nr:sulfite exporter TauE/SafE family protein [Candidatus Cyanaurora vandensis]